MPRRRSFPQNRIRPRSRTTWVGSADQAYVAIGAGLSVIQQSFDPSAASMLEPTILRSRGLISVRLNSFASDLSFTGVIGMGVVTDDAFAAGAVSIPRPFDDADWGGWFVWEPYSFYLEFADAIGFQSKADMHFKFDSKAMRRVEPNETVVVMVESQSVAVDVSVTFRQLYKLS